MFTLSQKKAKSILFLDLYKSYVSIIFIDKNSETKNILEVSSALNYLKVANPKHELYRSALSDLLFSLTEKLSKKAASSGVAITNFHIFVSVHGQSAKVKNHEIFVKLKNIEELTPKKLSKIVSKDLLNETEFLRVSEEENKFLKSKKLISHVAPNYYKVKTWRSRKVREFSFLLSQSLIEMDLKNTTEKILSGIYPEAEISFINSNTALALAVQEKHGLGNINILDIGSEFISFYQLYDAQVVNFQVSNYSAGHLIRLVDKFTASYELSKSQILGYLNGDCKGEFCENIKNSFEDFERKLQNYVDKLNLNPYLREKILFIHNPDIDANLALWIADRFAYHINKKADFNIASTMLKQKNIIIDMLYNKNFHLDSENKLLII